MKNVFVEQYRTSNKMSHIKMTRQEIVLEVLDCLLQCDDVPFPRDVLINGTFFPSSRSQIPTQNAEPLLLGTSLSERYSGLGDECLLSCASRKVGLTLFKLTKWRSKIEAGSTITQTVYPSRMDETSSSEPDSISSSGCGKRSRLGDAKLDWMNGIANTGCRWCRRVQ